LEVSISVYRRCGTRVHPNFADQDAVAHFLKNISITGGLLQIVTLGAGTFSIDRRVATSPVTNR
jgi:putative oxidoreductase